jgi:hypothetical protein
MIMSYITYQKTLLGGTIYTSISSELERTVNYNTSIIGLSGAYDFNLQKVNIALGIRNLNIPIKTTDDYVSASSIAYTTVMWKNKNLIVLGELNTGDFPVRAGVDYNLASLIHLQSGIKYESNSGNVYGSFGLFTYVENFKFGFAVSNLLHDLGPTAHYSLTWKFR